MGASIRWTARLRALLRRWQGAPLTWLIVGGFVLMAAMAIGTALKLAAFIAAIMLAVGLLREVFGSVGTLIVAALSGIADVDAITISLARVRGKDVDPHTVVLGILIAVAVNTTSKTVLAGWAGGSRIGIMVAAVSAVALAGGAAALWWVSP